MPSFAAACQGQEGKTWNKCAPHHPQRSPLRSGRKRAKNSSWHPTVEQCATVIYELKHNKAPDAGGWTTESAKAAFRLPRLPPLWGAWLTHLVQAHPGIERAKAWHAHKLVCLKKPTGGHRPILISSVRIKLLSGLLLKEAGGPLKIRSRCSSWRARTPHQSQVPLASQPHTCCCATGFSKCLWHHASQGLY